MEGPIILLFLLLLTALPVVTFFLVIVILLWLGAIECSVIDHSKMFDDLGVERERR